MTTIYFTEQEMMDFLNQRGWELHEQKSVVSQHLHGSRFLYHDRKEWVATKGENTYKLKEAFAKDLKHKLLYE